MYELDYNCFRTVSFGLKYLDASQVLIVNTGEFPEYTKFNINHLSDANLSSRGVVIFVLCGELSNI